MHTRASTLASPSAAQPVGVSSPLKCRRNTHGYTTIQCSCALGVGEVQLAISSEESAETHVSSVQTRQILMLLSCFVTQNIHYKVCDYMMGVHVPLLFGTTFHYLSVQPPRLPLFSEDLSKHTFSTWPSPRRHQCALPPVDVTKRLQRLRI